MVGLVALTRLDFVIDHTFYNCVSPNLLAEIIVLVPEMPNFSWNKQSINIHARKGSETKIKIKVPSLRHRKSSSFRIGMMTTTWYEMPLALKCALRLSHDHIVTKSQRDLQSTHWRTAEVKLDTLESACQWSHDTTLDFLFQKFIQ